jgi:cation transport protein ChaC
MIERVGTIDLIEPGDIWVFAYGSLMWDPGFEYEAREPALMRGFHRAFCVSSPDYRGTRERPGLVLGLVAGGSCRGIAFRIAKAKRHAVMAYLEAREMPEPIYHCRRLGVITAAGRRQAYAFVVNRTHELYVGKLAPEAIAQRILHAVGNRGPNRVYLDNTVRHLDELGLGDTAIHAIHRAVQHVAVKVKPNL